MKITMLGKAGVVIFLALAIISQCTSQQTRPTLEDIMPSLTSTTTLEPEIIRSPTIATTPTQGISTLLPDFNEIGFGQYILVQASVANSTYLYIISTDKTVVGNIPLDANVDSSSDGKKLLIMKAAPEPSYIYDFADKKWSELLIQGDCTNASWSPEKSRIALSCINEYVGEIYVLDTISNSTLQITNCLETDNSCSKPAWSFDGKWLSYFRNDERSGIQPRGIHVFDTGCIENNNCMNAQSEQIEANSNAVWSLKNELILSINGTFQFLKIENSLFVSQEEINNGIEDYMDIDYSPDGEYLAYMSNGFLLYLYSRTSGMSEQIFNSNSPAQIIGWIVIQ